MTKLRNYKTHIMFTINKLRYAKFTPVCNFMGAILLVLLIYGCQKSINPITIEPIISVTNPMHSDYTKVYLQVQDLRPQKHLGKYFLNKNDAIFLTSSVPVLDITDNTFIDHFNLHGFTVTNKKNLANIHVFVEVTQFTTEHDTHNRQFSFLAAIRVSIDTPHDKYTNVFSAKKSIKSLFSPKRKDVNENLSEILAKVITIALDDDNVRNILLQ